MLKYRRMAAKKQKSRLIKNRDLACKLRLAQSLVVGKQSSFVNPHARLWYTLASSEMGDLHAWRIDRL